MAEKEGNSGCKSDKHLLENSMRSLIKNNVDIFASLIASIGQSFFLIRYNDTNIF